MTSKKTKLPKLKHDQLFKKFLEQQIAAKEFLTEYLPPEAKEIIDLNKKIELDKDSFIEPNLKQRFSDVLLKVATKSGENGYIYCLAEHQNTTDKTMPLRLWQYVLLIAQRHIDTHGKDAKIPLIIPYIIHAGSHKYSPPRNLWQMFEFPQLAKEYLTEDNLVIDLSRMTNEEMKKQAHLGMMNFFLKNAKKHDILKVWEEFFEIFHEIILLDEKDGYVYLRLFVWYTDQKVTAEKKQAFNQLIIDNLPTNKGENIVQTIADTYIEEGLEKGLNMGREEGLNKGLNMGREEGLNKGLNMGREEGLNKGLNMGVEKANLENAKRMLERGADLDFVAGVTNLSMTRIKEIASTIKAKK